MNKSASILVSFMVLCMSLQTVAKIKPYDKQAPRTIKLNNKQQLQLSRNGKVNCEIVILDGSTPVAKFAAQELAELLGKVLKAKIPVLKKPTANAVSIIIGDNKYSRKAGITTDKLPRDGYYIKSSGNNIYIVGIDDPKKDPKSLLGKKSWLKNYYERASLFGVYDFLDRFCGVKMVFSGDIGTITPYKSNLSVPAMDIFERPDFIVRTTEFIGKWYDNNNETVGKCINYYRLRLQTEMIPNNHGLKRMGYMERFTKKHPEYFALMPNGERYSNLNMHHTGQLCFNSGINEEIYKDMTAFLKGESAKSRGVFHRRWNNRFGWDTNGCKGEYFNVMPPDSYYECRCEKCQKELKQYKNGNNDIIWKRTSQWGKRLKKDGTPGYLTQMAYASHKKIPEFDIPDNVLVMVATQGPWFERLPKLRKRDNDLIKNWVKKIGHRVWLWNYVLKYAGTKIPGIPISTPRSVGKYYKQMSPEIFGAFMQTGCDYSAFQVLNHYIFAKVNWNNNIDIDQVLSETYRAMFGPATEPMKDFLEMIEELWLTGIFGKPIDTPAGPTVIPPSAYDLWGKVYNDSNMAKLNQMLKKAEKSVKKGSIEWKRVKFFRKNFYDRIIAEKKKYKLTQNSIASWKFEITPLKTGEVIQLDGNLNDKAWKNSKKIFLSALKQKITEVQTIVKARCDKNNLYLAFDCKEAKMDNILSSTKERDDQNLWRDSCVEIILNPSGDRSSYYQFIINAHGTVADMKGKRGKDKNENWNWNSSIKVKTIRSKNNWTIELAIPLKDIGAVDKKAFPANFSRSRYLKDTKVKSKYYSWSPFIKNYHDIENFGFITFEPVKNNNIIINGNFNLPKTRRRFFGKWFTTAGMVPPKGNSVMLDNKFFISGGQSGKISNDKAQTSFFMQLFPKKLIPGKKYRLSFFVRTKDMKNSGGGVFTQLNDGRNSHYPRPGIKTNIPWTRYSYIFTARDGAEKKNSYLRLYNSSSGTAWFDEVKIEKVEQ